MSVLHVNESLLACVYAVGFAVTAAAIIAGAVNLDNVCENAPLTITLAQWLLTWGSFATAVVFLHAIGVRAFDWIRWLFVLFLAGPWLSLGLPIALQINNSQCSIPLQTVYILALIASYLYIGNGLAAFMSVGATRSRRRRSRSPSDNDDDDDDAQLQRSPDDDDAQLRRLPDVRFSWAL